MFTGIITGVGRVVQVTTPGDTLIEIECSYDAASISIGASVCCAGACLTVTERRTTDDDGCRFKVAASAQSLARTTIGGWQQGTRINLERALKMGDELGGHMVSGHVDGVGHVRAITPEGSSRIVEFEVPPDLARFIAPKGSVTLDGTSFTVNEVTGNRFAINIIGHTLAVTTWEKAEINQPVNVEIDMLARYVARLQDYDKG